MFCAFKYYDDKTYGFGADHFTPSEVKLCLAMPHLCIVHHDKHVNFSETFWNAFVSSLLWKSLHNFFLALFKLCFLSWSRTIFHFHVAFYILNFIKQNSTYFKVTWMEFGQGIPCTGWLMTPLVSIQNPGSEQFRRGVSRGLIDLVLFLLVFPDVVNFFPQTWQS